MTPEMSTMSNRLFAAVCIAYDRVRVNVETGEVLVKRCRTGQFKPATVNINNSGYPYTVICYLGRKPKICIHHLIWIAANGPMDENLVIDHINRDRADNRLENLRQVSQGENARNSERARGEKHKSTKIPDAVVRQLRAAKASGQYGAVTNLARSLGISPPYARNVASGRSRKYTPELHTDASERTDD